MPNATSDPLTTTRSFTGRTVAECLLQARRELGPEAVLLDKRTVPDGTEELVQVTFGIGEQKNDSDATAFVMEPIKAASDTFEPKPIAAAVSPPRKEEPSKPVAEPTQTEQTKPVPEAKPDLTVLEAQVAALTASVQALLNERKQTPVSMPIQERRNGTGHHTMPERSRRAWKRVASEKVVTSGPHYLALLRALREAEVAEPFALQWIGELTPGQTLEDAAVQLRNGIARHILITDPLPARSGWEPLAIAVIGASGVGKTTTLIKLAARYAMMERRRVGIITLDTLRIAAPQQLLTYGEILQIPVKVAHEQAELAAHLKSFADEAYEIVLVDTPGHSPHDLLTLGETAQVLSILPRLHKILVLPATLAAREMETFADRFGRVLAPDSITLTKVDEASDNSCFGRFVTLQARHGLPLSYLATGQKVPEDITIPDSRAIASRLVPNGAWSRQ